MLRYCALCLCFACARPPTPPQAPRLSLATSVEREIGNGQTHQYEVTLAADTVLFAEFDQLGADVALSTYDPDGTQLKTFDSPTGSKGTELVRVDAKRAGTYRIDVAIFGGRQGKYRAHIVEIISAKQLAEREAKERATIEKFFEDRHDLVAAVVEWAKANAVADVSGIMRVIGDARVIALGEADHGVHDYLAYRNELAKYLVEKHIVTAILVESGFTEATAVDDYIMGTSTATATEVAPSLFMWGMPAAMRDNVELIEWLHAYNAKASRKVHVYGVDVTGGRDGLFTDSRLAIDAALAYLAQNDPAAHQRLEPRLTPLLPKFSTAGYLELDAAQRTQLTTVINELLAAFKPAHKTAEFRRARQHAAMAAVLETFFRQTVTRSTKEDLADVSLDGIRDATMAANVLWALEQEGAGSRVFLFAHNSHVRRAEVTAWPSKLPPIVSMGQYLANSLHGKLVVIGAVHGEGPPTATIDGLLSRVGLPSFVVDLRSAPETVRAGLGQSWEFRLDGFRALGLKPAWSGIPSRCFDALFYTSTATTAELAR